MIMSNFTLFDFRLKSLEEKPSSSFSHEDGNVENGSSQDLQVRMAPPDPKSPHLPLSMENINDPFNNINANTISISNNDDLVKLDRKGEEVVEEEDDEVEENYEILTNQEGKSLSTGIYF